MAKALWVLKVPSPSKVLVKKGQAVISGEQLVESDKKTFQSPVAGTISDVSDNKIKIEFITDKIEGTSFGPGRCWGELEFLPNSDFLCLEISLEDKIVFTHSADELFVTKAEAVGVKAVVCYDFVSSLPEGACLSLLTIDKDDNTESILKRSQGLNCLVDLSNRCLFIPKSKK